MRDDGPKSYSLALAALREKCIRKREIQPRPGDADEARWAREGVVPDRELETVRRPP